MAHLSKMHSQGSKLIAKATLVAKKEPLDSDTAVTDRFNVKAIEGLLHRPNKHVTAKASKDASAKIHSVSGNALMESIQELSQGTPESSHGMRAPHLAPVVTTQQ